MSTISLYPDMPCAYPNTVGANVKTTVGNTPSVLAVFRNDATVPNLRGIMQHFAMTLFNATDDTLVTIQFVGNGTAVGGDWTSIGGTSQFSINTTATDYTNGVVALTMTDYLVAANKTTPSSLAPVDAEALGLKLHNSGTTFAIVAFTSTPGETVDIAWSVNWLEKD